MALRPLTRSRPQTTRLTRPTVTVGNADTLQVGVKVPIDIVLPGGTADFAATFSEQAQQDVTIAYTVSISGMFGSDWTIESDNPLTSPEGGSSGETKVKIHDNAWYGNDYATYWISLRVTTVTGAQGGGAYYGRTRAQ